MRKLLVLLLLVIAVGSGAAVVGSRGAAAGGWAVPAFDPLPPIEAGTPVDLGLTLLAHGVTPVAVDGVAVAFTSSDGAVHRFAGRPGPAEGRYLVMVELPAGTFRWTVEPGWYPPYDLGEVTVTAATASGEEPLSDAPSGRTGQSGRRVARIALPVLAVVTAAVAITGSRRRPALVATALLAAGTFLAWRDTPVPARATAPAGAVPGRSGVDGETLFAAKGCAWCHRTASNEPIVDGMPDLTDIARWGGARRPGLDAAAYLAESVRAPEAYSSPQWHHQGGPTTGMPALAVTDGEIERIVDHLLG